MEEQKIAMTKCSVNTYESLGSFPELRIDMTFAFYDAKRQIANVDMKTLKERALQLVYLQCVKTDGAEGGSK